MHSAVSKTASPIGNSHSGLYGDRKVPVLPVSKASPVGLLEYIVLESSPDDPAGEECCSQLDLTTNPHVQTLVHDIKSAVVGIAYDLKSLRRRFCNQPEIAKILSRAQSSCSLAAMMAANVLDVGRMEDALMPVKKCMLSAAQIEELAQKHLDMSLFAERTIWTSFSSDPDFQLRADPYLLDRMLQNLITNAALYGEDGGCVTVTLEAPSVIKVHNSGRPISPEFRSRVFEKYARASYESSGYSKGLGLFFCRLSMSAHKGRIELETFNHGNTFVLRFPHGNTL